MSLAVVSGICFLVRAFFRRIATFFDLRSFAFLNLCSA